MGVLNAVLLTVFALATWVCGQESSERTASYWIEKLTSDRFVAREQATLELVRIGGAAVAPLKTSIKKGNRETVSRGAYVLFKLAMDEESEAAGAAYLALRELLESNNRSVVGVARKHIDQVHVTRQAGAMAKLIELGAVLKDERILINRLGRQAEAAQTLEIGDDWKGKTDDLRHLRWLYTVSHLAYRTEKAQGEWFQYAAQMDSLERIAVRGGQFADSHLQLFMKNQSKLRIMELKYVPVSDKSIEAMKKHLTSVVSLKLYGTKLTVAGAERLRGLLPQVDVDVRRGGFLGVSCQTHPLGCHVSLVQPKSAAEKSGFATGDVIFQYGGTRVTSFESLTTQIAKHAVDDAVKVHLARGFQATSLMVVYNKDGLKVKGKPHALGFEVESFDPSSPLAKPGRVVGPFPVSPRSPVRPGDIIVRINDQPIPADKSPDEVFKESRDLMWKAAFDQAKAKLQKEAKGEDAEEGEDAEKGEDAEAKAQDAKARAVADEETKSGQIFIQFARGGKVFVKDVVLGAWE